MPNPLPATAAGISKENVSEFEAEFLAEFGENKLNQGTLYACALRTYAEVKDGHRRIKAGEGVSFNSLMKAIKLIQKYSEYPYEIFKRNGERWLVSPMDRQYDSFVRSAELDR